MSERYRKKPVVIEAMQYGPSTCADICAWMGIPHNVYPGESCGLGQFLIQTLEGEMRANPGDWIIRGVRGEFYPCKPAIFAATYELATGAPSLALRPEDGQRARELAQWLDELVRDWRALNDPEVNRRARKLDESAALLRRLAGEAP